MTLGSMAVFNYISQIVSMHLHSGMHFSGFSVCWKLLDCVSLCCMSKAVNVFLVFFFSVFVVLLKVNIFLSFNVCVSVDFPLKHIQTTLYDS